MSIKYILFFITHSTLTHENCELTFYSISIQNNTNKFDKMYIYNTHPDNIISENRSSEREGPVEKWLLS